MKERDKKKKSLLINALVERYHIASHDKDAHRGFLRCQQILETIEDLTEGG